MTELSVRTMTPSEYEAWLHQLSRDFAEAKISAGDWPVEGAFERAWEEITVSLPQGLDTPDMLLLKAILPDGTPVGRLWIGLEHPRGAPDCAFLHDIEIEAEHRGRGFGRALMVAAEQAVAERGVGGLALNVFGENKTAIGLYESAGYRVTSQQMSKRW